MSKNNKNDAEVLARYFTVCELEDSLVLCDEDTKPHIRENLETFLTWHNRTPTRELHYSDLSEAMDVALEAYA